MQLNTTITKVAQKPGIYYIPLYQERACCRFGSGFVTPILLLPLPHQIKKPVTGRLAAIRLAKKASIFVKPFFIYISE